ncbi:MAG: M20/M25/M40 family metallo-hydrolase [bacterium]|nr:M20/M25/M40 family metallo-hydrolase [bacterium]
MSDKLKTIHYISQKIITQKGLCVVPKIVALTLFSLISTCLTAQSATYLPDADSVMAHVMVLADDSLEGREVGEPGELKAAQYIAKQFEKAGLEPAGDNGTYLQSFGFIKAIDFGTNNHLTINGMGLQLAEDFVPLKQSWSGSFDFDGAVFVDYGIKTGDSASDYNDYAEKTVEGKAVIIKRFSPSSEENPHVDFSSYSSLTDKIRMALDQKAAGIIFVTPEGETDTLSEISPAFIAEKSIPIFLLRNSGMEKAGIELANPDIHSIAGELELVRTRDTGYNVIGLVPAKSDTTIILGAHYDHLGWGTPSSLYRGDEPMIHNGADDNASGTAALIELARHYSSQKESLRHSFQFVAFSGEEAGLLGSSHVAKNEQFDPTMTRVMLNMDMIGRVKDQDNELAIMGTGTSTEFPEFFETYEAEGLKITKKESGTTPSDNTMFYNRSIPSLMFFTGAHSDYHRPTDDADKIDADGIVKVANVVASIADYVDSLPGPLTFQKTKDPEGAGKRRSRFSVSLGVMPDYVAEVKGLKIDGVTPEKPAAVAGIQEGDIVIRLGEYGIGDIYEYMNALGKFRKGDSCQVIYVRGSDTLTADLVF